MSKKIKQLRYFNNGYSDNDPLHSITAGWGANKYCKRLPINFRFILYDPLYIL